MRISTSTIGMALVLRYSFQSVKVYRARTVDITKCMLGNDVSSIDDRVLCLYDQHCTPVVEY